MISEGMQEQKCRFCLQKKQQLIEPCACKEANTYACQQCLEQWIKSLEAKDSDTISENIQWQGHGSYMIDRADYKMECKVCGQDIEWRIGTNFKCCDKQLQGKNFSAHKGFAITLIVILIVSFIVGLSLVVSFAIYGEHYLGFLIGALALFLIFMVPSALGLWMLLSNQHVYIFKNKGK